MTRRYTYDSLFTADDEDNSYCDRLKRLDTYDWTDYERMMAEDLADPDGLERLKRDADTRGRCDAAEGKACRPMHAFMATQWEPNLYAQWRDAYERGFARRKEMQRAA